MRKIYAFALASAGALAAWALGNGQIESVGAIAIGQSHTKAPARSAAQALTVPFTVTPDYQQFSACTQINTGNPDRTWQWDSSQAFYITYGLAAPLDNWIILPAMELQAGSYDFSCQYKTKTSGENFEIYLLSSPDDLEASRKATLLEKKNYCNSTYTTSTAEFAVTSTGTFYIGIHASSPADRAGIYLKNISLKSAEKRMPQAATLLTNSMDGLQGTFQLKLPTKDMAGNAVAGNISLDMKIDGQCVETKQGAPGSAVTFTYSFTEGPHSLSFIPWINIDSQRLEGPETSLSVTAAEPCPDPIQLPYTFTPTQSQFAWCDVIDNNNDERTWKRGNCSIDGQPAFISTSPVYNNSDEWLILPKINFPTAGLYTLDLDLSTANRSESFEIMLAPTKALSDFYAGRIVEFNDFSTKRTMVHRQYKITIATPQTLYLAVHAKSASNSGDIYLRNIALAKADGSETYPPAISSIDMQGGNGSISVTLPTESYDGEELDSQLTAWLSIDGGAYKSAVGMPGEEVVFGVQDLAMGEHTAKAYVTRTVGAKSYDSDPVERTFLVTSPPDMRYSLPMALNLGQNFNDLTIVNANSDRFTWEPAGDAIKYSYSAIADADDWAFTRPVTLTEENCSQILRLAIEAREELSMSKENFQVWIGTAPTPEAMTMKLLDVTDFNETTFQTLSQEFAMPQAGDYVIGMHVSSPGQTGRYLYLQNLQLEATSKSAQTPAPPTDLYAEGDETGAAKLTVCFDMPRLNCRGAQLDAMETLTAYVTCGSNEVEATGKPGQYIETTIDAEIGENIVSVVCENFYGEGIAATTTGTCGLDIPSAPRILTQEVSEDNRSFTLTWRAVTTGQNGGIAGASVMTYNVYVGEPDSAGNIEFRLKTNTPALTYTYDSPEGLPYLDTYYVAIEAQNAPGSVSETKAVTHAVLGKPYDLPLSDDFGQGMLHAGPVSLYSSLQQNYAPQWYIGDPAELNSAASCPDQSALIGHTEFSSGDTQLELPKVCTLPDDPDKHIESITLALRIYLSEYTPSMQFVGLCCGKENSPVTIGALDTSLGSGWTNIEFDLPADLFNQKWVAIRNLVDFARGASDWALIDGYSLDKKEVSSVESISGNSQSVTPLPGSLCLRGFAGQEISITSIDAAISEVRTVTADQWSIALPSGLYIVNTPQQTYKVRVP